MNYHKCRYANCAVCIKPDDREIFEHIFQRKKLDIYLCKHVAYKIYDDKGINFIISDLSIIHGKKEYYIISPFTGNPVVLNTNNFDILCTAENCTVEDPYVSLWKSKVTKGDQ